jgi:hypothetical protein
MMRRGKWLPADVACEREPARGGTRRGFFRLCARWSMRAHAAVVALVVALVRLACEPAVAPLTRERPDTLVRADVPCAAVSAAMSSVPKQTHLPSRLWRFVNVVGQYGHEYSRRVRSLRRATAAARVAFDVTRRRIGSGAVASGSVAGGGADAVALLSTGGLRCEAERPVTLAADPADPLGTVSGQSER